jgi:hypothetical protein
VGGERREYNNVGEASSSGDDGMRFSIEYSGPLQELPLLSCSLLCAATYPSDVPYSRVAWTRLSSPRSWWLRRPSSTVVAGTSPNNLCYLTMLKMLLRARIILILELSLVDK